MSKPKQEQVVSNVDAENHAFERKSVTAVLRGDRAPSTKPKADHRKDTIRKPSSYTLEEMKAGVARLKERHQRADQEDTWLFRRNMAAL